MGGGNQVDEEENKKANGLVPHHRTQKTRRTDAKTTRHIPTCMQAMTVSTALRDKNRKHYKETEREKKHTHTRINKHGMEGMTTRLIP